MRYAIISDIHSNLESFSEFLKLLPKLNVEKIICLGDIVGYNANPNEVIDIFSKINNTEIIRGNHDRAVSFNDYSYFSEAASEAVIWTIKNLRGTSYNYLKDLQQGPKIIDDTFAICHGSALDEDNYLFSITNTKKDFTWLKNSGVKILFFGHTHHQKIFCMNEEKNISVIKEKNIFLDDKNLYIINPGSIGQPRDNDPRGSFAIFDSDKSTLDVIRYNYPIEETQKKIIDQNLPEILAYRLMIGK